MQIIRKEKDFDIIQFSLIFQEEKYTVVTTSGLSNYEMPVTENYKDRSRIEFCTVVDHLWDFNDAQNQWIYEKLAWLGNYLLERKTWFSIGHTIPNGKPAQAISNSFSQQYFYFDDPTLLSEELKPIEADERLVHFLCLLPISEKELNYKMSRSNFKFKKKLASENVTEVLELYRPDCVTKKFGFWS